MTVFVNRRAILISGGMSRTTNHIRYWNDLSLAYACLQANQFKPHEIDVFYANGGQFRIGPGRYKTTKLANRRDISTAITDSLNVTSSSDDLFVLVTTNHGDTGLKRPGHTLQLWNGDILTYKQLEQSIGPAQCNVLGIFGHCFSADMLGAITNSGQRGTRAAVAASKGASYAMEPDWAYDEFMYHFFSALSGISPAGYRIDADTNQDGHVDIYEAYQFAVASDRTADQPDFEDNDFGNFIRRLTLKEIL